jgi:cytoskeletal protein RodZ
MTIGNQLKKARQKKHLSLDEVYQQTRIHPHVLAAMEEDRFDKILNAAYVRSFLKEYAGFLDLDVQKILSEYNQSHPKDVPLVSRPLSLPPEERKFILPKIDWERAKKPIAVIAGLILAIILVIFFIKATSRTISKISEGIASRRKQIELKKQEQARAKAVTEASSRKEDIATGQKPEKSAVYSTEKLTIPKGEKLKLTITVTDDVWLQLKVDGKIIFQNVVRRGSVERWEASDRFELWTGKAEATHLDLNGVDLGTAGEGVRKGIIIDRQGISY